MTQEFEAYLGEVKRLLCAPSADRERLISGWRHELEETQPDVKYLSRQELRERLGAPEVVAREMQTVLSQQKVAVYVRNSRRQMWFGLVAGGLALALATGCIAWAKQQGMHCCDGKRKRPCTVYGFQKKKVP